MITEFLSGNLWGKPFGRSSCRGENNIKWIKKFCVRMLTMDSSVPGQGPVLGCYEHGTDFFCFFFVSQMAENFFET
jgi:hypothetical protein